MKLILALIMCMALSACDQWRKMTGKNGEGTPVPAAVVSEPTTPAPAPSPEIRHTWILGGQSNMYGSHMGPDGDYYEFPSVPQYQGLKQGPGYGVGVSYLRDRPNEFTRTVNCSMGGTSINQHQEGQEIFEACIQNIAEQMGPNDILEGVLWWQGESDAIANMPGPEWQSKFQRYIDSIRRRTGKPNLPILFVQIGELADGYSKGTWEEIKTAQETFCYPYTSMVRSDDQTLSDHVHYDANSNITIGERLYSAWISIVGRCRGTECTE